MVICFTLGLLWPPGESEEEDGKAEEPTVRDSEHFAFDWAHTWLEEGGAPIVDEDKSQGLLSQVFWFSVFLPPFLVFYFPYAGLCLYFKINWSIFFRV